MAKPKPVDPEQEGEPLRSALKILNKIPNEEVSITLDRKTASPQFVLQGKGEKERVIITTLTMAEAIQKSKVEQKFIDRPEVYLKNVDVYTLMNLQKETRFRSGTEFKDTPLTQSLGDYIGYLKVMERKENDAKSAEKALAEKKLFPVLEAGPSGIAPAVPSTPMRGGVQQGVPSPFK